MKARFTKLRKLLGYPGGAEMEPGRVDLMRLATTAQISITDEMFKDRTAHAKIQKEQNTPNK